MHKNRGQAVESLRTTFTYGVQTVRNLCVIHNRENRIFSYTRHHPHTTHKVVPVFLTTFNRVVMRVVHTIHRAYKNNNLIYNLGE